MLQDIDCDDLGLVFDVRPKCKISLGRQTDKNVDLSLEQKSIRVWKSSFGISSKNASAFYQAYEQCGTGSIECISPL